MIDERDDVDPVRWESIGPFWRMLSVALVLVLCICSALMLMSV